MKASTVLGVLILARNGDRTRFHQDPYSYEPAFTESTPLGAVCPAISSPGAVVLTRHRSSLSN